MWRVVVVCVLATLSATAWPAFAGTVHLRDGSVVHGEIKGVTQGQLVVLSGFAGKLTIAIDKVQGVATDQPMVMVLDNGTTIRGRLAYKPGEGQRLRTGERGVIPIDFDRVAALHLPGARPAAEQQQADPWSGRLLLGISGSSGNEESFDLNVGIEAKRETERQRLYLSLETARAREDGELTDSDIVGAARLEYDFSESLFVFGKTEIERAEFENIDVRSTTAVGLGYFFVQQEDHEFKARLGVGYEYVQPETNTDNEVSEAILTLGWNYMLQVNDWFTVTHELTVVPKISNQPAENFRVDSVLGLEAALGEDTGWSVVAQYRHEYKSNPQEPGVEELDTSYLLTLVRSFE